MRLTTLLIFFLLILTNRNTTIAQQIKDSIYAIEEVRVSGYPDQMRLLESPVSVGIINKQLLANQPGYTLVPALNMISGVRMEERSPGSYRLSIRGSLLRSPFGIRNVKLYIDEFPLTDASGNTYLNLIDAGAIQKMEILKGPHGSLYGANTGGVAIINPNEKTNDSLMVNASFTVGSYGLWYEKASFENQTKRNKLKLYQARQQSAGYRENSALDRKYFQINDVYDYHKNLKLKAFAFYSDLNYQTPGGLTLEQFQLNPAAARPSSKTTASAKAQKAAIENKTIYGGLAHETQLHPNLRHVVALFGTHTDFINPAIANYELRNENTLGLRTYIEIASPKTNENLRWKWNTGMEWQQTSSTIKDFGNKSGAKDTLQTSREINARQYFVFTQFTAHIGKLTMEAGLSVNNYQYQYRNLASNPVPAFAKRSFDLQWLPRAALSYGITDEIFIRTSVSKGYSAPTIEELLPSGAALNINLQAESGWNYEAGLRFQNSRIKIDVVAFNYNLQNAIVRRVNENGTDNYINSGGTRQPGLEWQLNATLLKPKAKRWINSLDLFNSITLYRFSFQNYKNASTDYTGNKLTGVPQNIVATSLNTTFYKGLYLYIQHNYTSTIPLNDQNTDFAPSYHLVQLKCGWKYAIKNKYKFDLYGGVDNLLNANYSLGNDINAFGKRYYNAAPLRSFYVGLGFWL